ncbi:hypothetical protein [Levilactobacillus enshiensis]|uniref:hypothetical protein n=1 Tax=Levilactobacillus enshiensis TaxID=2590213 RepID=UPI00117B6388|nr:hypothetical protein [Levilactobacillus enshiensis]
MKSIKPLIIGYDVCCLIALMLIPVILRENFVTQVVNLVLISVVAYSWMREYFKKIKSKNWLLTLSWYLRIITVFFPLIVLILVVLSKWL